MKVRTVVSIHFEIIEDIEESLTEEEIREAEENLRVELDNDIRIEQYEVVEDFSIEVKVREE